MIQFYCPDIAENPVLPESDSQHCVRVLRMREGDELQIVDGVGHVYQCRLADAHPKHALVQVIDCQENPLPWSQNITVAVAPTKHMDRMEWLVEKLVEIGINAFVPLKCRYSERKEIKEERLEKIAVSAMKQSLKAVLPKIYPMIPFSEAISMMQAQQKFIAYCDSNTPRLELSHAYTPNQDVCILIGPEGDFSPEEVNLSLSSGFKPVTLGNNRLRTETAALYACTAFHVLDSL